MREMYNYCVELSRNISACTVYIWPLSNLTLFNLEVSDMYWQSKGLNTNNYQACLHLLNWFEVAQLQKWHSPAQILKRPLELVYDVCSPLHTYTYTEKVMDKWDDRVWR